jgi:hypothetical protein
MKAGTDLERICMPAEHLKWSSEAGGRGGGWTDAQSAAITAACDVTVMVRETLIG